MRTRPSISSQAPPYANVVKEWFKLPGAARFDPASFSARRPRRCGKANKIGPFPLARRLQSSRRADQKGSAEAMDNSLLVSLSQQLAAYRAMDVIANNLANVSTPGFKREAAKFEEYVTHVRPAEGQTGPQTRQLREGCRRDARSRPGQYRADRRALRFRHHRQGLFAVQTPHRHALHPRRPFHPRRQTARSGHQPTAMPVQGDGGAITITPNDGNVSVAPGRHHLQRASTASATRSASCKVVDFANERALIKQGANLYSTTQTPTAPANVNRRARACWKPPTSSR